MHRVILSQIVGLAGLLCLAAPTFADKKPVSLTSELIMNVPCRLPAD